MSLILHAGAKHIDRNQLAALPLPAAMGSRHVIRPFIEDVELISGYLKEQSLQIVDEAYGVKTENEMPTQFFGALEVQPIALEGEVITAKEFALTIGLRGSYDQSLPRGLAIGSRVFVCDNLAFSGEITIATRQTLNIGARIPAFLQSAVARIPALAFAQEKRFDAYKNTVLKPRHGDAALIEMVRKEILNPSQIGRAIAEWDKPGHDEHADGGYTLWRLQNAVTEAIKPANMERAAIPATWNRTIKLTAFLDDIAGVEKVLH